MTTPLVTDSSLRSIHRRVVWLLWLLLLVSIPVTSFPFVAQFLAYTPVSPLALLPLAALVALWLVPYAAKGRRLPAVSGPVFVFVLIACISATAATALPIYPIKGQTVLSREIRALVTLAIGLSTYLCACCLPATEGEFKSSLKALNVGAVITLMWASLQAVIVLDTAPGIPMRINELHRLLSIRDLLDNRVVGLAYEPSWLGDQLVTLYMPLWISAILCGTPGSGRVRSLIRWETLFLLWGGAILVLTQSRVSFLSLAAVASLIYLMVSWRAAGAAQGRLVSRVPRWGRLRGKSTQAILTLVATTGLIAALVAVAWAASKTDRRLERLFLIPSQMAEIRRNFPGEATFEVANRIAFAERVVYWDAGFKVFEEYPLLGVGPGNAGFLFPERLPAYGYRLLEVQQALDPANPNFINPKNLWIRLLSETGILGFLAFSVWMILLGLAAQRLYRRQQGTWKLIGLAGLMALVAQIIEGFSLDSYALPHVWIIFGLLTASAWRARHEGNSPPS